MTQSDLAQMALHSELLRQRIRYLMTKAALAKLAAATPSSADILLGQRILKSTESVDAWSLGAMTNPTIAAGAHQMDGSTILDADLEFAVNSLWPAMSM